MSRHVLIVLYVIACLAARAQAAEKPADFDAFWRQSLLQLRAVPANPTLHADTMSFAGPRFVPCQVRCHWEPQSQLAPVVYLLDRADAASFAPSSTHSWVAVDVAALWPAGIVGPEPTRHPMYTAVLVASRALELLLQRSLPNHTRAGLVGEGRGGGVALALAALSDNVAFVAAHEPLQGPRYAAASPELQAVETKYAAFRAELPRQLAYFDLPTFAAGIKCPALVSYGGRDAVVTPDEVIALYGTLTCEKQLAEFPRAGHCLAQDLQDWCGVWREWAMEQTEG